MRWWNSSCFRSASGECLRVTDWWSIDSVLATNTASGRPNEIREYRNKVRRSVLDPRGDWIADVLLPTHFSLFDAGRDYVAGVTFDTDELERVTVLVDNAMRAIVLCRARCLTSAAADSRSRVCSLRSLLLNSAAAER